MFQPRARHTIPYLVGLCALLGHAACSVQAGPEITIEARESAGPAYPKAKTVGSKGPLGDLVSLTVSPKELLPAFSPDVHDYVVRCDKGLTPVDVAAKSTKGGVVLSVAAAAEFRPDLAPVSLGLAESQAFVVRAAGGEYFVRCLPHDFPPLSAVELSVARAPGYYLLGSATVGGGAAPYAMILDEHGTPIWYQKGTEGKGVLTVGSPGLGRFSFAAASGVGDKDSKGFAIVTLDPYAVAYVQPEQSAKAPHEIDPEVFVSLPNHHHVVLTHELATDSNGDLFADCIVQDLDAQGRVTWDWRARDHVDPVVESVKSRQILVDGADTSDPFAFDGLDLDQAGNLLLTARGLDAVLFVDRASGAVRYKLGGSEATEPGAVHLKFDGDPESAFGAPADARFGANGDVTLFDARGGLPGPARAVQYALDLDEKTATLVRAYVGVGPSEGGGGFRVYDDGTKLISWGSVASGPQVTEIDTEGKQGFALSFGGGSGPDRAIKVPVFQFDKAILRAAVRTL